MGEDRDLFSKESMVRVASRVVLEVAIEVAMVVEKLVSQLTSILKLVTWSKFARELP
jgi:hypothetical protein